MKAGLLLSLFGGVRKNVSGAGTVPVRGSVHCLVVGAYTPPLLGSS
jgi:DNA helicase MCM8